MSNQMHFSWNTKEERLQGPIMNKTGTIFGVDLKNGTVCRRQPVVGRKRCEEHNDMRVTGSKFTLPAAGDTPLGS